MSPGSDGVRAWIVGPFGRASALMGSVGPIAVVAGSLALVGCSDPPPPPPPPPPVVDRGPTWTLDDIEMDPRVQFPERYVPSDRSLAQAVADIASGLVSGDRGLVERHLAASERETLDELVSMGAWESATGQMQAVRIVLLSEFDGAYQLGIAYQAPPGARLLALEGEESGGGWEFSAMPVEPVTGSTLAELDDPMLSLVTAEAALDIEALLREARENERMRGAGGGIGGAGNSGGGQQRGAGRDGFR